MVLNILILVLAIPIGLLIAKMARDELVQGKPWFRILIIASIIAGIWFYLTGQTYITWTAGFAFVVALISLIKAEDKKWVRRRI